MWAKPLEVERLIALRDQMVSALGGHGPFRRDVHLQLTVWVGEMKGRAAGDLDTYVAGICDGLQRAPTLDWRRVEKWSVKAPEAIRPDVAVGLEDDSEVVDIEAHKRAGTQQRYELTVSGEW